MWRLRGGEEEGRGAEVFRIPGTRARGQGRPSLRSIDVDPGPDFTAPLYFSVSSHSLAGIQLIHTG